MKKKISFEEVDKDTYGFVLARRRARKEINPLRLRTHTNVFLMVV